MVRVKWWGNGSKHFDGLERDVAAKYVHKEDLDGIEVGSTIRVKWGRSARTWTAVVVAANVSLPAETEAET